MTTTSPMGFIVLMSVKFLFSHLHPPIYSSTNKMALRAASRSKAQIAEDILTTVYGTGNTPARFSPAYCEGGRLLHADAFGVYNYVSLHHYHAKGKQYLDQARYLTDDVHAVLGRERTSIKRRKDGHDPNDAPSRLGNATNTDPLIGGLRTGKVMSETRPSGDGQTWHSIVMWAWALNRLAVASDDPAYNMLAAQLLVATGVKFLQRTLDTAEEGEDVVAKAPYTLSTRMSIDLSYALPATPRGSDPLIGALVVGVILNGMGPRADRKVSASLQAMERQLVNLWKATAADTERVAEMSADASQIGDLLWVASWAEKSKPWGAKLGPFALELCEQFIIGTKGKQALLDLPLQARNPLSELWLFAGSTNFHQGVLKTETSEAIQELLKQHSVRMNLWGPHGMVCNTKFNCDEALQ